jgi:hypothetical protein
MKFVGAVLKEQNVKFAVVKVKPKTLESASVRDHALEKFDKIFEGLPIVLVAEQDKGAPTCFGRKDIAQYLATVKISQIPWKQYTYD